MRTPISAKKNIWFNGEAVDNDDLTLEQDYNDAVQTSIINNHIGSGVLNQFITRKVIFDSSLATGLLDGKAIDVQAQPSDVNYGNQLEIGLSDSLASGNRKIKIFIIGLDFNNNLQYDTFIFTKNESQFTNKHYIKVLKIFFNDFIGDPNQSFNLGGKFTIKESKPLTLSRDCIMVAQDMQPNIFVRDFFVSTNISFNNLLVSSLPTFNIDTLDIASGYNQLRALVENDVSSQIGQKFQATTNNIQKITLLMSVINNTDVDDLEWTGDIIVSIFQLQSSLDCPLDIAPGSAIDFDPSNIPLAQISLNYNSLLDSGIELNGTPQPIDFVFSNTPVGSGNIIKPSSYYVITMKRAGSADKCALQLATGTDRLDNSKITFFNGSIWVDVPDEDLWFQVWTDSAKVLDGQAYDAGHGIIIPKTKINESTGITEDYCADNIQFVRNDVYYGVVAAASESSVQVQDQRTGENVFSQQQFVPNVQLITSSQLMDMGGAAEPLIVGSISDKNLKSINIGSNTITSKFHHFSMIGNKCIVKVIDDPSDGYRYDLTVLNLITELTGGGGVSGINSLINGKIVINTADTSVFYRISDTEIISMLYGDLNGDGVVDDQDLAEFELLLGNNLNTVPTRANYITLTTPFKSDHTLTWALLDDDHTTILDSGSDGSLTANPQDKTRAIFSSATVNFNSYMSLNTKQIRITGNTSNPGNNGTFIIKGHIDSFNVDIQKNFYESDTILKLLAADINGDMQIDSTDLSLLTSYVEKTSPFPNPSSPANRIGTRFNAIRFTVEKYVDRADDYFSSNSRAAEIHVTPDILNDGYEDGSPLYGVNLKTSPVTFTITKQLNWKNYFVQASSNPKLVPLSFNYQSGFNLNQCELDGNVDSSYPLAPEFDPGRNDIFLPNNLVINNGGEIVRPDGYYVKMDFEVGSVILEMPAISFATEKTINIFSDFVVDFTGDGRTRLGYEAMRFADCSFVEANALSRGQVRFSVDIRSFSPQINGTDADGISGVITDGRIGITIDPTSGMLTLNFTNLYEDPVLQTLKTRVQVTVFLKKAGFNNNPLIISSTKITNLLGL